MLPDYFLPDFVTGGVSQQLFWHISGFVHFTTTGVFQ